MKHYQLIPMLIQESAVIQRLEKLELEHKHDMQMMNDKIVRQDKQILSQNQEISGLKEEIANSNQDMTLHQNQILQIVNEQNDELSGYVSFTAYATTTRSYNEGDHVLFDGIIRNYGSSYLVENSTFVCPFDAYYLFSASIRSGLFSC